MLLLCGWPWHQLLAQQQPSRKRKALGPNAELTVAVHKRLKSPRARLHSKPTSLSALGFELGVQAKHSLVLQCAPAVAVA